MADMKKVSRFVEERNITPIRLKLETFINKVRNDISKGEINITLGNKLLNETTYLLKRIRMPEEG